MGQMAPGGFIPSAIPGYPAMPQGTAFPTMPGMPVYAAHPVQQLKTPATTTAQQVGATVTSATGTNLRTKSIIICTISIVIAITVAIAANSFIVYCYFVIFFFI